MPIFWVKFGGGEPVKVEVSETADVYDVIESTKNKLPERLGKVSLDNIFIVLRSTDTIDDAIPRDKLATDIYSGQPVGFVNSYNSPIIVLAPSAPIPVVPNDQSVDRELIDRVSSSVLCLSQRVGDGDKEDSYDVIATAIVWDYTFEDVLLLTNYHTWDVPEFRYCFPPKKHAKGGKRKHEDPVEMKLHNEHDFKYEFELTSDLFYRWEKKEDFAVLKLPKSSFTMQRILVSNNSLLRTMKIHAFGYISHTNTLNTTPGEVCSFIPYGFTMNFLSAPGFSGAAIVADGRGRAVGYMGGNLDASKKNNSQHQSYAFKFDGVISATNRQASPNSSPGGK